mmetsp:Transcript_9892/g.16434  ORF Transcript_9892/g.16434 Transcript_9892/m.16434 type:complete len:80 (+) Transcript_9892:12-251(+)
MKAIMDGCSKAVNMSKMGFQRREQKLGVVRERKIIIFLLYVQMEVLMRFDGTKSKEEGSTDQASRLTECRIKKGGGGAC